MRRAVEKAVAEAERTTGLQFCVAIADAGDDPRAEAERLFLEAGMNSRPAVLVLVDPECRRVEVVTAREVRTRIGDPAAAGAVEEMTTWFGEGNLTGGLVAGLRYLAAAAGPGAPPEGAEELPDIV